MKKRKIIQNKSIEDEIASCKYKMAKETYTKILNAQDETNMKCPSVESTGYAQFTTFNSRPFFAWNTLNELQKEVLEARSKHHTNEHLTVALMEEVGELAKDLLENKPTYKQEALQVAVVALRIYEEGDSEFDIK